MFVSPYKFDFWLAWVCFWMGWPANLVGQELIFRNIGEKLELPSYECYNVVQDGKGYIWISTDNGLCRFNGKTTTVFNKKKGLPDNAIYFLKSGLGQELRLISSGSTVLKWTGHSFAPENYSQKLKSQISRDGERAYLLQETRNGDVINTYSATYLADRKTGSLTLMSQTRSTHALTVVCDGRQSYFVRNHNFSHPQPVNGRYALKLLLVAGKRQKEFMIPFDQKVEIDRRIKLTHIDGFVCMAIDDRLLVIDKDLSAKVYDFPSKILNLYADPQKGLWVGLFHKGVYYYKDITRMNAALHSLREYSVTGTLVDREGGVWCATLDKNIFYSPCVDAVSYSNIPELSKIATLLKTAGGKVLVSTAHDNLIEIKGNSVTTLNPVNEHNQDYTDVCFFNGKWYLASKTATKVTDAQFIGKYVRGKQYHFTAGTFDPFDERLFAADFTELFEIHNDRALKLTSINASRIRSMACVGDGVFFIGDHLGLGRVNLRTGKRENIKGIATQVNKILRDNTQKLWIATKGDGLNVLENGKLRRIAFKNRHDIFFDLAQDASGRIWASSEHGLVSISEKDGGTSTRTYDTSNGLLSNDVGYIAIDGNRLIVSTIEGLCAMNLEEMVNDTPPKIYLSSISANKIPQHTGGNHWEFAHDQNSIALAFDVLTFKNDGHDMLQYRFKGDAAVLAGTADGELHFDNLPPDNYQLEVFAVNNDGVKSAPPITLVFTIHKPFWKTYWFVALCMLLATAILYFSVKRIIVNVRKKEMEKTKMNTLIAQSQLSALQAQMNPHFIFNAISSIQNYILKNDETAAYNYLAKFGKLIRMVLNNSRESTLPLAQELETLQLYVQLEQLRFRDSFTFELTVDEAVDTDDVHLPTMLIQPYVENAIWHGLMNLENTNDGVLKLKIAVDGDLLKIVVEDNGVGRERAEAFKRDTLHHSVGMQLTEQRLQTIFKLKEYKGILIDITDLKDGSGNAIGTRVVLSLPLNS